MKINIVLIAIFGLISASYRQGDYEHRKNSIFLTEPRSGGVAGAIQAVIYFLLGILMWLGWAILWVTEKFQGLLKAR